MQRGFTLLRSLGLLTHSPQAVDMSLRVTPA